MILSFLMHGIRGRILFFIIKIFLKVVYINFLRIHSVFNVLLSSNTLFNNIPILLMHFTIRLLNFVYLIEI